MDIILMSLGIGIAIGACLVGIAGVLFLAYLGISAAVLVFGIWCEDQWEAFWRWKSR